MRTNKTQQPPAKVEPKKEEWNPKKYEKNGLTEDEVLEIKEAFDLFDNDKSGQIDVEELKTALKNLGIDAKNQTLSNMMADLDRDNSGQIDFDEFIDMMTAKMSDRDTKEDLQKVFRLFLGDDEKSEKIDIKHLKRVAKELNENMSDEELQEMIKRADLDNDGKVDFNEFYQIMTKKI
jgi:Ca2+-binding EF-hand superfamily protein